MERLRTGRLLVTIALLTLMSLFPGCNATRKSRADVQSPVVFELGITTPVETALDHTLARPALDIWLEMINGAEKTLDLGQFYLCAREGEPLDQVVDAVMAAHNRGVRVRILTDARMNKTYPELAEQFQASGIAVRLFDWKQLTGGILHAKYMIVDGKSIYVGSQNFDWRSLKHIQETGIRVDSPVFAQAATAVFDADWAYTGGDATAYEKLNAQPPVTFPANARLLASPASTNPPGVDGSLDHLVRILDGAHKRITIQLLSYSTHRYGSEERFATIDDALRRAAGRGVEVEMIISNWNKRHPEDLMALSAVPGIRVRFMNIPEATEGFIPFARVVHSKVVRVDEDICWISTSNWSYDYFYASRNLEVLIRDRMLAMQLNRLFTDIWNSPYGEDVTPDGTYTPPRRE